MLPALIICKLSVSHVTACCYPIRLQLTAHIVWPFFADTVQLKLKDYAGSAGRRKFLIPCLSPALLRLKRALSRLSNLQQTCPADHFANAAATARTNLDGIFRALSAVAACARNTAALGLFAERRHVYAMSASPRAIAHQKMIPFNELQKHLQSFLSRKTTQERTFVQDILVTRALIRGVPRAYVA